MEVFFLNTAINLLEPNIKNDFKNFLNNREFNPHNLFICKRHSLIKQYYNDIFNWLFRCEEEFKHLQLDTFRKKRIYGFLAERYLPFWFKKYIELHSLKTRIKYRYLIKQDDFHFKQSKIYNQNIYTP